MAVFADPHVLLQKASQPCNEVYNPTIDYLCNGKNNIMTKIEAIKLINEAKKPPALNDGNTIWSNYTRNANEEGWWVNIPLSSFKKEIHIVLNRESAKVFLHLKMRANEILSPAMKFRCKDQMADIFISAANMKRLADTQPGGSKHSFSKNFVAEYRF
jgi:hypothetical protein